MSNTLGNPVPEVNAFSRLINYVWGSNRSVVDDDDAPDFIETGQSDAVLALASALPGSVFSEQSPHYRQSVESYFALQCTKQRPGCIVRPNSTAQVATALKTLKPYIDASFTSKSETPLHIAIRSGGHSCDNDMSSMDGGIVLDLALLKTVDVAEDRQTTVIGSGNRWGDVSTKLDEMGLAVAGGRNSSVGVGGLVLGGGLSFLSPQMGMVCDNIIEYEIVLPDGTITHATATHNEDLWRALKGGSNNFGIVTHFTANTVPFSKVWAARLFFTWGQTSNLLKTFHEFNKPENFDPYAAGPILGLAYLPSMGLRGSSVSLVYTKPEAWAPVWAPFRKLWRIWGTAGITSLTAATDEYQSQSPYGNRQAVFTTTIKNDLESLLYLETLCNKAFEKVKNVQGVLFPLAIQPLTPGVFRKGSPNVLGLETRDPKDSFVIVLCCPCWKLAVDDEIVIAASRDLIEAAQDFAEKRGAGDRYRYLNYCAKSQDPLESYGQENVEFMRGVSRKYDPTGVFQRAVPGGFKLGMEY